MCVSMAINGKSASGRSLRISPGEGEGKAASHATE